MGEKCEGLCFGRGQGFACHTRVVGCPPLVVSFSLSHLHPFFPMLSSMAACPMACPRAMVWTGGLMYLMQSAMAKASVSNPTGWPWALLQPGELMYM